MNKARNATYPKSHVMRVRFKTRTVVRRGRCTWAVAPLRVNHRMHVINNIIAGVLSLPSVKGPKNHFVLSAMRNMLSRRKKSKVSSPSKRMRRRRRHTMYVVPYITVNKITLGHVLVAEENLSKFVDNITPSPTVMPNAKAGVKASASVQKRML